MSNVPCPKPQRLGAKRHAERVQPDPVQNKRVKTGDDTKSLGATKRSWDDSEDDTLYNITLVIRHALLVYDKLYGSPGRDRASTDDYFFES